MSFNTTTISSLHWPLLARRSVHVSPPHILDLHFRDICLYILYYVCFTCTRLVDYQLRFDQQAEETNIPPLIVGSPTPSTSTLSGMRLRSHVGFSCANKHSPITLAISLTLLRFVTPDGWKGETRQEKHSGHTIA